MRIAIIWHGSTNSPLSGNPTQYDRILRLTNDLLEGWAAPTFELVNELGHGCDGSGGRRMSDTLPAGQPMAGQRRLHTLSALSLDHPGVLTDASICTTRPATPTATQATWSSAATAPSGRRAPDAPSSRRVPSRRCSRSASFRSRNPTRPRSSRPSRTRSSPSWTPDRAQHAKRVAQATRFVFLLT